MLSDYMVKKKEIDKREVNNNSYFTAVEWARMEGIDYHLFLYWKDNKITKEEFEKLKKEI